MTGRDEPQQSSQSLTLRWPCKFWYAIFIPSWKWENVESGSGNGHMRGSSGCDSDGRRRCRISYRVQIESDMYLRFLQLRALPLLRGEIYRWSGTLTCKQHNDQIRLRSSLALHWRKHCSQAGRARDSPPRFTAPIMNPFQALQVHSIDYWATSCLFFTSRVNNESKIVRTLRQLEEIDQRFFKLIITTRTTCTQKGIIDWLHPVFL